MFFCAFSFDSYIENGREYHVYATLGRNLSAEITLLRCSYSLCIQFQEKNLRRDKQFYNHRTGHLAKQYFLSVCILYNNAGPVVGPRATLSQKTKSHEWAVCFINRHRRVARSSVWPQWALRYVNRSKAPTPKYLYINRVRTIRSNEYRNTHIVLACKQTDYCPPPLHRFFFASASAKSELTCMVLYNFGEKHVQRGCFLATIIKPYMTNERQSRQDYFISDGSVLVLCRRREGG